MLIETTRYQKPTDTGLLMSFHACALTRYKINIIQGTVHILNNTTSKWSSYHDALAKTKLAWENNQYPPSFYNPVVYDTLIKLCANGFEVTVAKNASERNEKRERATLIMQYRGSISDRFARSVRGVVPFNIVFTTSKLKTALPSLKTPTPNELRSRAVYEIRCPRCQSSHVVQTSRHLTTRQKEHSKPDCPVGKHFRDCLENTEDLRAEVPDSAHDTGKLLTLEALHTAKRKPQLNTCKEYRSRQLMLKLQATRVYLSQSHLARISSVCFCILLLCVWIL